MMRNIRFEDAQKDPALIIKINRAFHDVDAEKYSDIHPEIYNYEKKSWEDIFSRIRKDFFKQKPVVHLDVGTGTGFVPLAVADYLRETDELILSDISSDMLQQALKNCSDLKPKISSIQIDGTYDMLANSSVDIATVNSVLHHIPQTEVFFSDMQRILKPGGILVIKHEPNARFLKNTLLVTLFQILRRTQKMRTGKKINRINLAPATIMERLQAEGIVFDQPLSIGELQSLVDIHSPTARGGVDFTRGFDPFNFVGIYKWQGEVVSCNTYGFFGKIKDDTNQFRKKIAAILRGLFPKDGYYFDIILQKKH